MPEPTTVLTFADEDQERHPRLRVDAEDRTSFVPVVPGGVYDLRRTTDGLWVLVPRPPEPPYRVVDRFQRGWYLTGDLTGDGTWETYPRLNQDQDEPVTLEKIVEERGPVRPVLPPTRQQSDTIKRALVTAKTKAATTLLVALYRLARECYDKDGHDGRMVAGRAGSWEAVLLPRLAHEVGANIRATRVDEQALTSVLDVLRCWIFAEDRFVEMAETIAWLFGEVTDGRGGWDQVADQWLRRSVYEEEVTELLLSTSRWYGPHTETAG